MTASPTQLSRAFAACLLTATVLAVGGGAAQAATAPSYVPGTVVVGYRRAAPAQESDVARVMGVRRAAARPQSGTTVAVIRVGRGRTVGGTIAALRHRRGVAYAVPDYIAHIDGTPAPAVGPPAGVTGASGPLGTMPTADAVPSTGSTGPTTHAGPAPFFPNDPGRGHTAQGWEQVQWNFLPGAGVDAPQAWGNLIADGHPGGQGIVVAVLDTGIAYRDWKTFHRSPDFGTTHFVDPWDFVANNAYPVDREGHGTFVAGTIAESTNNGVSLTGLAYGASIMPVRVLDAQGNGGAAIIAKGVRYAVNHGAQVINLSLEFGLGVTAREIPEMMSALRYAYDHGVVVVGAGGNDSGRQIAYPARAPTVIAVGATTKDRCLADYSNIGRRLNIVAPGGGQDTDLGNDPNCHPFATLPDIFQTTFFSGAHVSRFGLPQGWYGTSMAAPHVSAIAALVIASRVIGSHPSPAQLLVRLEQTAQPIGNGRPNIDYGYGLVDAAAATSRSTPPYAIPAMPPK